jgi:hypothetical protein
VGFYHARYSICAIPEKAPAATELAGRDRLVEYETARLKSCCTKTTSVPEWTKFDLRCVVLFRRMWQNGREVNCLFRNLEQASPGWMLESCPMHYTLRSV